MIISMLAINNIFSSTHDISIGELVEQNEEQVDVNFIARNMFNNNPYRNNYGSKYPRPYDLASNEYPRANFSSRPNGNDMHALENYIKQFKTK